MFFVVMYHYGAMVINLARRGYLMLVITLSVISVLRRQYVCLTVCGYVFVYLCVRSPISQYNFAKCGTIVT